MLWMAIATFASTSGRLVEASESLDRSAEAVFRDAKHSGLNGLYLLLRVNGWNGDYESCLNLSNEIGVPDSVYDLLAFARRINHPLVARAIAPALLHVSGSDPGGGMYCLLLRVEKRHVVLVNATDVTVVRESLEPFLRKWSGLVVVPTEDQTWLKMAASCGVVIGIAAASLILRARHHA
jgi:hypothetical protein